MNHCLSICRSLVRLGVFLVPLAAHGAEPATSRSQVPAHANVVDMFQAMDSGEVAVQFIPRDEFGGNVFITNNTDQPITVRLPETFSAMPVLAQRGRGGGGRGGRGGGRGGGNNNNVNQGVGGGMGGMGGGGGGFFNIAAEDVGQMQVATVCLEHGKKAPRAAIPYELWPLDELTVSPGVRELMAAYGNHELDPRSTQAAAWHLANELPWEELASKTIDHLDGTSEPWFDPQEIMAGMQLAAAAKMQAERNQQLQKRHSPGDDAPADEELSALLK